MVSYSWMSRNHNCFFSIQSVDTSVSEMSKRMPPGPQVPGDRAVNSLVTVTEADRGLVLGEATREAG